VRVLALSCRTDLDAELGRVGADPACWPIFAAKAETVIVKLDDLSVATANILKQTALLCGADCAVHSQVITGRVRRSDALLFGTRRQLAAVADRLGGQPECAARLAPGLREQLSRQAASGVTLRVGSRTIDLAQRTRVMGIVNVTPDSFSDGGRFLEPERAVEQALKLEAEGADFLDLGAESTRPGARPVEPVEQMRRLRPVLRGLRGRCRVPISVDTMSARVARAAADEGAAMVNDVSGLSADGAMARTVKRYCLACVMMHMKGEPRTMQRRPAYSDLMGEIVGTMGSAVDRALAAGIERDRLVVDPGIGFGKSFEHNHEILRRLSELRSLGLPVMVGPSRKAFIGAITGEQADTRLEGTIAACLLAAVAGASIVRVHDVGPVRRALAVADAVAGRRTE
jgi:dihydropteroate synthase